MVKDKRMKYIPDAVKQVVFLFFAILLLILITVWLWIKRIVSGGSNGEK
jgi:predicted nucleic acid-binding Zn ribbon protein